MDEEIDKKHFEVTMRTYQKGNHNDKTIDKAFNRAVVIRRMLHDMYHSGYNPFVPLFYAAFYKCALKSDTSYLVTESASNSHSFQHLKHILKDKYNARSIMALVCQVLVCLDRLQPLGCVHNQLDLSNVHVRPVTAMIGDAAYRGLDWDAFDILRFAVSDGSILELPNMGAIAKLENWNYAEVTFPSGNIPKSISDKAVVTTLFAKECTEPIMWVKDKYRGVLFTNSFDMDTFIRQMHITYKDVCPELSTIVDYLTFHGAEWSLEHGYPITLSQQRPCEVLQFIKEHTQCMKPVKPVKQTDARSAPHPITQQAAEAHGLVTHNATAASSTTVLHSFSALLSKINDVNKQADTVTSAPPKPDSASASSIPSLPDESLASKYAKIETMLQSRLVPVWSKMVST